MGIQSFVPSSGGLPGQSFIGQIYMSTSVQNWNQSGAAGFYTVKSTAGQPGYVYFVGSITTGGPLNTIIQVPGSFSSVKVIGSTADLCVLYQVSTKTSTAISTTPTITSYTASGTYSLASNKTGFIDAFLVGGGGGASHHSAGAGGGGAVLLSTFPLTPGVSFSLTVGAGGSKNSNGGDTIFANIRAKGGGGNQGDSSQPGYSGGCGGGGSSNNGSGYNGGSSTQASGADAIATPLSSLGVLAVTQALTNTYGTSAAAAGYGNAGGHGTGSSNHCGAGGGGLTGVGTNSYNGSTDTYPGNGGPGYLLSWNNTHYGAGGSGSNHAKNRYGTNGTGWSASGYGMGGWSHPQSSQSQESGTQGIVIVRSYDI